MKKKLLFVCHENLQRSPTAASLFRNNKNYTAKSAGTGIFSPTKISSQAVEWADIIFCMESAQKRFILKNFPKTNKEKIHVLNIPDVFPRNDPRLISVLEQKLKKWLIK